MRQRTPANLSIAEDAPQPWRGNPTLLPLLVKFFLTFQVRLSFLTAPSFALLDHPLPLVLRLENNCERTVCVPVL